VTTQPRWSGYLYLQRRGVGLDRALLAEEAREPVPQSCHDHGPCRGLGNINIKYHLERGEVSLLNLVVAYCGVPCLVPARRRGRPHRMLPKPMEGRDFKHSSNTQAGVEDPLPSIGCHCGRQEYVVGNGEGVQQQSVFN